MWEIVIMIAFALMVLSTAFLIGLFVGIGSALDVADAEHQRENDSVDYDDLYCFQCETEMPVKEVSSRLYCHNCGLRHTNDFY